MINEFIQDESGATMTEYAVLIAVIAMAVIVTVVLLQISINEAFQAVLDAWEEASAQE